MNKVSDESVYEHIRRAASDITPNKAGEIWEKNVTPAVGNEWYLDGVSSKRSRKRFITALSSIAACFLLCIASVLGIILYSDATVYLDVNPSIELKINRFNKVTQAYAANEDGKIILDGMNLRYTELDVALNAILGSMVKHGYLNEANRIILVSVECADDSRADKLKKRAVGTVQHDVNAFIGAGRVLSRNMTENEETRQIALQYGISRSKAAFLQQLAAKFPNLKYEELANLSVSDMLDLLDKEGFDISDMFDDYGTDDSDADGGDDSGDDGGRENVGTGVPDNTETVKPTEYDNPDEHEDDDINEPDDEPDEPDPDNDEPGDEPDEPDPDDDEPGDEPDEPDPDDDDDPEPPDDDRDPDDEPEPPDDESDFDDED